jgi:hypothetical protein
MPLWTDSTGEFDDVSQMLDVPAGADELIVTAGVFGATGWVDFRGFNFSAWVSTFDDEFDGAAIDTTRWTVSDGYTLLYAPGEQYFAPDHVIVQDGIARFHADSIPKASRGPRPPLDGNFAMTLYGDYRYQSGEIRSLGKFQQLYGYYEFRLKIPIAMGTWPAAYLLGWDEGWPPEIDVEECSGSHLETGLQTNVYADDYGRMHRSWANFSPDGFDRTAWHTYAIAWEPDSISWYIDGVFKGSTTSADAGIADVPMYIRLNLAVGTFGGDPTQSAWPQDMDCDYARVYQRADLPLPLYLDNSLEITLPTNTVPLKAISINPTTRASITWSLAEGPARAAIRNPHALSTSATFTKAGMYRFHLIVAKGATRASRDLLVYVNPAR